jgi:hypothetical protein
MAGPALLRRLAMRLRARFPEAAGVPDAELTPVLESLVQRSRTAYGLDTVGHVKRFVFLAWALGAKFDDDMPVYGHILADRQRSAEARLRDAETVAAAMAARLSRP